MVCLEYLEEAFPASQNQIMPRSAEGRAQARYWCIFINEKIIPQYYKMLMRPSLEEQDAAKRDLIGIACIYLCWKNTYNMMLACYFLSDGLLVFARAMDPNESFFFGDNISIVDISLLPWFQRYPCK